MKSENFDLPFKVFVFAEYYPKGGMNDFKASFDSLTEAKEYVIDRFNEDASITTVAHAQIVTTNNPRVYLFELSSDESMGSLDDVILLDGHVAYRRLDEFSPFIRDENLAAYGQK